MSNQIDLMAVSIDPAKVVKGNPEFPGDLFPGSAFQLVVDMKNNGPDTLLKGEGTCQITISSKDLILAIKPKFVSKKWKLLGVKKIKNQYNLFLETKADMMKDEPDCGFYFNVKAKVAGTSFATLASSLSVTSMSSDINGTNQSVRTEIVILPKEVKKK